MQLDKVTHGAVSVALVLFLQQLFEVRIANYWLTLLVAILVAFAVGVLKEAFDKVKGGSFDKKDLLADAIGVAVGSLLSIFCWYVAL